MGGTTHGALYLLDREHEHFRRAGLVGLAAESCFPGTLPLTHHPATSVVFSPNGPGAGRTAQRAPRGVG